MHQQILPGPPGGCHPPVIIPHRLKGFSDWYQICRLGRFPTPAYSGSKCPVKRKAEKSKKTKKETKKAQAEANGSTRPKEMSGGILPSRVRDIYNQFFREQEEPNHVLGYRWLGGSTLKKWTKKEILKPDNSKHRPMPIECHGVFMQGMVVCDLGAKVEVKCALDGQRVPVASRCGCGGRVAQHVVKGFMPHRLANHCHHPMEKWAGEQRSVMISAASEVFQCGLEIMYACKQRTRKLALESKMIKDGVQQRADQQMIDAASTIRIIRHDNKHMNKVMHKLRNEIKETRYTAIPGFALADGAAYRGWGPVKCKVFCDRRTKCKSYSYNSRSQKCMWSASTIAYDDNYVLYTKTSDTNTAQAFVAIAGMRIGEALAGKGDTTIAECQYKCIKSETCTGAAYSATDKQCIVLVLPIAIGSDWNYYEKQDRKIMARMEREMMELRHAKMTLSIKHMVQDRTKQAQDNVRKNERAKQIDKLLSGDEPR